MFLNSQNGWVKYLKQVAHHCRKKIPLPLAWHYRLDTRRLDKIFKSELAQEKDHDKKNSLNIEWNCERLEMDEKFRESLTERLLSKAARLYIIIPPLPPFIPGLDEMTHGEEGRNEYWELDHQTGTRYHLTPEGAEWIRIRIHEEKKRAQERYLPWFTLILGTIGALIGLISVIKNKP